MPAPSLKPAPFLKILSSTMLGLALHGAALAQTANTAGDDIVTWTVSAPSADTVKQGGKLALELRGVVLDGWHVYALEQLPAGPTPLVVKLEANQVASANGALAATPPTKFFDPSFKLDTQYYAKPFTLTVPVRIAADAAPGPQQIPVSVHFQSCDGRTCKPPKTLHLSATINVQKAG